MRVLPHHQDTGGFFIAVLQKQDWLPWQRERKRAKVTQEPTARTSDTTLASATQNTDCSPQVQDTVTSVQDTATSPQDTTTSPQDTTTSVQDTTTLPQDTTTSVQDTTTSVQDTATLSQATIGIPQDSVNSGTKHVSMEGASVMELESVPQSSIEDVPTTQLTQAATEPDEEGRKEATADIPPEDRPPVSVLGRYVYSPTS